ncbi:MAG: carboxypeptidase-like regulatory domain-containing protein [Bacteroidales bacterium]|nr:carboxypeptidase-like regulatory domain-containing protein [Bacteroidales bacterium]
MKTIGKLLVLFLAVVAINANANNDGNNNPTNSSNSASMRTIKGQVVDKQTGEALAGVAVKIDSETIAYTDFEGNFSAVVKNSTTINLNAKLISYTPENIQVSSTETSNIKLELNPIED